MHALTRRGFLALSATSLLSACATTMPITPAGPSDPTQMTQQEITTAINAVRGANGRAPWNYSVSLEQAARTHSNLMAANDKLSHELGGTLRERVTVAGYLGAVGENLAGGHNDIEHAIQGWLNSPGHRSTLLSDKFTEFGLAASRAPRGKLYWTLIAGGSFDPWRVWI
jgi:uncharacterized protein YkwD